MGKKILIILSIVFLFFVTCVPENSNKVDKIKKHDSKEQYDTLWKQVTKFKQKGLPKSALKIIEKIYIKAKKNKNIGESLKALLYKFNYIQNVSEETLVKIQKEIRKEIKENKAPIKQLLHSIAAEQYWNYYKLNRYKFLKRGKLTKFKQDDMRTWDIHKLVKEVVSHYKKSITDIKILKNTDIKIIDKIIYKGNFYSKLRPTMYDFLMHRAIDFFSNTEANITKPIDTFTLNKKKYLSDANNFLKIKLKTSDPLAFKYYALKYLQDLLLFHKSDKDPYPFIDVDLKRLKFIYSKGTIDNQQYLYETILKDMATKYQNNPAASDIYYELAFHYVILSNNYQPLKSLTYRWYKKKALELCKKTIKKYPNTKGAINCSALINSIKEKNLNLLLEKTIIPNKPAISRLTYRNVKNVFFKIVKTNRDEQREMRYKNRDKVVSFFNKKPSIKEWNLSLPTETDFQKHSTEIKIKSLPPGKYVILLSPKDNFNHKKHFISYSFVDVSNISYVYRVRRDKGLELHIINRDTGKAIKNGKAQIFFRKYNKDKHKYEFIKDKLFNFNQSGYLYIPFNSFKKKYFSIELITQKESIFIRRGFNLYNPYNWHRVRTRTYFFTDRSIYRPGQTVHFKGIVVRVDNKNGEKSKILKDYSSTVIFYDVNGQKIDSKKTKTNEFGTFSGSFTIPLGLLNGNMRITNSYGTKYISVEEYKRPKFEVKFKKITKSYRVNDTVTINGFAKAFSGYNIDNAKLRYRIERNNFYPYRWYYSSYYLNTNKMEIKNGFSKTNHKGEFSIKFKAVPDKSVKDQINTAFRYTIYVDITDINGETRSAFMSIYIGNTSLKLSIVSPNILDKDKKKHQFTINSTNLSGDFIKAKGTISFYKLLEPDKIFRKKLWDKTDKMVISKDEYSKLFPYDIYKDENNPQKWKKEKMVFSEKFDTGKNKTLTIRNLNRWQNGKYLILLASKDRYGNDIKEIKYFTLYSKYSKKPPYKLLDWFANSKSIVEPGNYAEFLIGTSDKDVRIIFETEYRGSIIDKKIFYLNNEQKRIKIPIEEKHRGNLSFNYFFMKHNRYIRHSQTIFVPWSNKKLSIKFETFRDKLLPGEKEEWKIKIKGKNGDLYASEMVASLYDSSLDTFRKHNWDFNIYPSHMFRNYWNASNDFGTINTNLVGITKGSSNSYPKIYNRINWFGFYLRGYDRYRYKSKMMYKKVAAPMAAVKMESKDLDSGVMGDSKLSESISIGMEEDEMSPNVSKKKNGKLNGEKIALSNIKARTNLNETAFFYPHLKTNNKGEVIISFTIPEALTKWKMLGFAHTKDLKFGFISNELKTQKELMVVPNPPRFFREKDKIFFNSKITNLSKENLSGSAQLLLFDSISKKPVDIKFKNINNKKTFNVKINESTLLKWELDIPEDIDTVTWRVVALANGHSDGEESLLPILKNRMLVTETLPLPLKPEQRRGFKLKKLIDSNKSKTLKHHKLTLEFTSNPAWYAVQSLPYLMEYPYECLEQTFSRFYANTIAGYIVNTLPEIKRVFEIWKKTKDSNELMSKLEKNQELKSLLLEETPWVRDAQNESQSKKRIALLFDLNKMGNELNRALRKLEEGQMASGAWPWFRGMRESRYITQHIISGFAHMNVLKVLNGKNKIRVDKMAKKAIRWLDQKIKEDYEWLLEHKKDLTLNHLNYIQIHYLYGRSYYKSIKMDDGCQKAFEYYKNLGIKYWLDYNKYMQGMISLYLNRYNHQKTAREILNSIKEHAIYSDEMGMYWKESYGYNWYRAPIERHALLIEAFSEVLNDKESVSALKTWLLKSKQTQNWKTTKATAEACYALLLHGDNWLKENKLPNITIGKNKLDPSKLEKKVEAGTGYFKTAWNKNEITPEMGNITVKNNNKVSAWGALYWQYFEDLDKITPAKTPLYLKKDLFVERLGKTGPYLVPISKEKIKIGDRIKVRIELRVDRDMEYVHMKDMRASGFEPENVISRYKWQDGLGYYESTKDGSTNFFIDYLRKGTYVFEYPLRATHNGDFSNGITSIQCMYAPEFASHSRGIRVKID